jgi:signal transduction histidine kinase
VVVIGVCIVIVGGIGALSYRNLTDIDSKIHFLEIATDLSNSILEIRRYEKNYFLYGLLTALEANQNYVQHGLDLLEGTRHEVKTLKAYPYIAQLNRELLAYQEIINQIREHAVVLNDAGIKRLEEPLRERGKALVDLSEQLLDFERKSILAITSLLKTQVFASLGVLVLFGGLLIPIMGRTVIRPLRKIEATTIRIAQGNFKPLALEGSRDEIERVILAFNRMVEELEKRQDQLVQAKKLSSLGVLTSGVAHQLNNPLNNIFSSCQILQEELGQAGPEFLHKLLKNVEQEVYRARDIVKGLLEFSREREFSLVPTPLQEVVERSVRLISSQVPAGIEIIQNVSRRLIIDMDAQRMQQVFLNLLMNGVQAIGAMPGKITVSARLDAEKKEAVIEVADSGKGIPEKDLGKIFDPFFTTKDVGAGTGLGLSIVYGIIQKHQGSISAQSKLGEGTRILIRLPLHPDSRTEGPPI